MNSSGGPRGDSFGIGAHGETVLPQRFRSQPLRSLRERQLALIVMSIGVLVATVDGSAVNVALPSIKDGLGFSPAGLAWVVNAYLIPFGGLLLLAGRLGDLVGTKRVFVGGLGLFTAASVVCGLAADQVTLIAARFAQGIGGALATAVVLSMLVTMFPKARDQAKAFGLYAFVASSGAAIGQIAGAVVTQTLGWQWIFFVNVPIGAVVIACSLRLLDDVKDHRAPDRIDWPGAALLVSSLMLAVYTVVQAADQGWGSLRTVLLGLAVVMLLGVFVAWQTRARHPLLPLAILRSRNVGWSNVVLALMVAGPSSMFFLSALYLHDVLGFTVFELGLAFVPAAVAVGTGSLKIAPWLMREIDAKHVLVPALGLMAVGLGLLARIPAEGTYLLDVLPAILLVGAGAGLATPPVLRIALAEATPSDSGLRSGLVNTTQQIGSAIGLAVLAPVSAGVAARGLADGEPKAAALTGGYQAAFLVGLALTVAALVLAVLVVRSEVSETAPTELDSTLPDEDLNHRDPTGTKDPDFLALGLGGTGMMGMLWSIAMGRRAVGIELRGDPYTMVMHWNIREDLYHHLAMIDRLMVERYGEDRIPRRGDGTIYRLAETLYQPGLADGGDARADEVINGYAPDAHIASVVKSVESVDDRWVDGRPHRSVTRLEPGTPSTTHDSSWLGRDMAEVLEEPAAFLCGSEDLQILLRRYLEEMERMDLAAGLEPRCRVLTYHRVVEGGEGGRIKRLLRGLTGRRQDTGTGFVREPDGRVRVRVEAIRELDEKGSYRRVRAQGTEVLDLGVPKLVMIAEGQDSPDARRLGFTQEVVRIDHYDGRGPVVAQADYLIGLIAVYVDSNCRRRVTSVFDKQGNEYWIRQSGIGHEGYVESGWMVLEVPDFMTFDPVRAGLVPPRTRVDSVEYFSGYRNLIRDYYLDQVALLTGVPKARLAKAFNLATPRLISVVSKVGASPLLAGNVVVAGESFGNGSFLTSGGAMTGMIGHASRVMRFWQALDEGTGQDAAIRALADGIRADTRAWLRVSEQDFAQPVRTAPDRELRSAFAQRDALLRRTREHRRSIWRFNPRDDWSRLNVQPGRLPMVGFQPLPENHPDSMACGKPAMARTPADGQGETDRMEVGAVRM